MSHKEKVRKHCMEYLQSRQLTYCYNTKEFDRLYRKSTPLGNPFTIGLDNADLLIQNYKKQS